MMKLNEKFCKECSIVQTSSNILKYPIGTGWGICENCFHSLLIQFNIPKNKNMSLFPEIQMVTQSIFIGNHHAAIHYQTIRNFQIQAICVCGCDLIKFYQGKKTDGKLQNILYLQHLISDSPYENIIDLFDVTYKWMEQMLSEGRNILVHCQAGVSRSASFIIAYLMKKNRQGYEKAYQYLKSKRKVIKPNSGFRKQLRQYQKIIGELKKKQIQIITD